MKWTYQFQNKIKTALLFMVVVVAILGCNFLEERYMKQMDASVSSIYKDRLMPEAYLLHINNHMFNKRVLLEGYLHAPYAQTNSDLQRKIDMHNLQIDSLISEVEETYLVPEEELLLASIKTHIGNYHSLETEKIKSSPAGLSPADYHSELLPVFNQLNADLLALSNIQTSVGKSLYQESRITKGSAWTISHLQIAIVIIITLAVHALLFSARSAVPKKFQQFNLN